MGRWYSELIPPAILLDHPGITADKYSAAISDANKEEGEKPYLLPKLLDLPEKPEEFTVGPYGYELPPPRLAVDRNPYRVQLVTGIKLGRPEIGSTTSEEITQGQLLEIPGQLRPCLVNNILSNGQFEYLRVFPQIESESFESTEELFKKYPQLRPENVYDLQTPSGRFCSPNKTYRGLENIGWKNVNGRYYFDEETFNRIPEGGCLRNRNVGYTDIILTAEIVRRKRWDLLDIESTSEAKESFLKRFPSSKKRVEKAVWDAQTSMFAKEHDLTNLELMHRRLEYNLR